MRSTVVLAIAVGGLVLAGCRFDRTPLSGRSDAPAIREDGSTTPDRDAASLDAAPASDAAEDAAIDTSDAGSEPSDASSMAPDAASTTDAETVPEQPVVPPMTGGLQCGGTFCAFGVDPVKPCCTTADDVAQGTARAAERCGLDLRALDGSPYGTHCWERDQPGIVDPRCPNLPAASGVASEPGCCTDDGACGTNNADHKLGCRHQPGVAPRACSTETPGSSCDPIGSFAVRFLVDAAWGGRSGGLVGLTDDGRGKIEVYVLMNVESVDPQTRNLTGNGRVCGVVLPPFYSTTLCEVYQPIFPISIWEADELPRLRLSGRYECAANGCVLSVQPVTYLLGFAMNNPEGPWPGPAMMNQLRCPDAMGLDCFPDHDGDSEPGVRVELQTEGAASSGTCRGARYNYRAPPLSSSIAAIFGGVRRTDRLQLGIRTKLGGTSRLADDCDSARGSAIAEYVNSRAAGCLVDRESFGSNGNRNERCQNNEAQFIDQNLPVYELLAPGEPPDSDLNLADDSDSRGPEVQIVRLPEDAETVTCEAVRDAKF